MKQESTRPANADQASVQLSKLLKSTCGSGAHLLVSQVSPVSPSIQSPLLYSCDRPYSNALAQAVTKPRLAAVALPPKTWPPKLRDRKGPSGAVASKRKGPEEGQKGQSSNNYKLLKAKLNSVWSCLQARKPPCVWHQQPGFRHESGNHWVDFKSRFCPACGDLGIRSETVTTAPKPPCKVLRLFFFGSSALRKSKEVRTCVGFSSSFPIPIKSGFVSAYGIQCCIA